MAKKKPSRPAITEGDTTPQVGLDGNRVHCVVGKTINLGNYESLRVEYGETRMVQPGESIDETRHSVVRDVVTIIGGLVESVKDAMS